MTTPASNMRSLDRSFDVLDVLQAAKQPMRLAEIARASGLHIATAQRIVNVLVARGYVARSGDAYTAGPAALAVAHAYLVSNPLSVLAQPVLQQLATNTGYTASLYVRVEYSRVLVARVESAHPLSYVLPVGERLPLHLGGAGKIFLADMDPDDVSRALDGVVDLHHADGSTLSQKDFGTLLDRVRVDGYAVSISERLIGIASVAAPVRAADGTLCAAIGLTGPADAIDGAAQKTLVAEARRAADALGGRIPLTK
ncbi:IclR family transcriptional regulator [Mycolicibacterium sp. 120266]|uniref:IclR family transcriptional regulator n=1 Tax=Mycolicibacterium sp. 120266 TaxID=3090601 RepID=UPI00299F4D3D|nr:IclR family transcriptional regulator [Mycolicibacterium sp. 120266]MDX1874136.1 IclR family transcriptional regulator [Mycolicibacterium sp. 120266]